MKPSISAFVVLSAIWLLLSGHYDALLLTFGLASVLGTLWCVYLMGKPLESEQFHTVGNDGGNNGGEARGENASIGEVEIKFRVPVGEGARYCAWLAKELLVSNFDVAKRVWQRDITIDPVSIVVPDDDLDDLGKVLYANSITLTPGTVSLFVRDDGIHVHALTQNGAQALAQGEMLRRVQRLRVVKAPLFR